MYLTMRLLWATVKIFGRSLRRLIRAVCPARAATTGATEMALPDGAGATPKGVLAQAPNALGENTRTNIIAESVMPSEKKTGRRRLESPHIKNAKTNKEDVPPFVASPERRKQSELNELREKGLVG